MAYIVYFPYYCMLNGCLFIICILGKAFVEALLTLETYIFIYQH